ENDFIFCLRGSLGKNCKYPYTIGAIASSLVILRKYALISDNYIELLLNSSLLKKYINQTNNGTAQPNLGARDIAQYLIPLLPLNEQIKIYNQYLKITNLLEL
ncbi:MAG: restriction endonuclease subunit S, partial [Solobacterium sp.]|nr:restriction endonuclease subunit S [Solobacterium sp.]